jgi:hypothetical protein
MNSFKPLTASALIFCCATSLIANEPAEDRTETNQQYQQMRLARYQESNRRQLWLQMRDIFPNLEDLDRIASTLIVRERTSQTQNITEATDQ